MPVKVFTADDYTEAIESMADGSVDIAWFGPLSYVLAEEEAGAEAFAVGVRSNGKSTYRSLFVVPGDSPVKSIMDLKGKSVAFVDPASTSGGLVPTFLVKKAAGMMPEDFFKELTYVGSHDAVEIVVKNRKADAGADNDKTYERMIKDGQITAETNRVIVYSDPLPGSPLTYRKDLDAALKKKIREAVLNAHKEIEVGGYGDLIRYEAAGPEDYQLIREMIKELKLSKEQILQ